MVPNPVSPDGPQMEDVQSRDKKPDPPDLRQEFDS
jgi:hypothetical protein